MVSLSQYWQAIVSACVNRRSAFHILSLLCVSLVLALFSARNLYQAYELFGQSLPPSRAGTPEYSEQMSGLPTLRRKVQELELQKQSLLAGHIQDAGVLIPVLTDLLDTPDTTDFSLHNDNLQTKNIRQTSGARSGNTSGSPSGNPLASIGIQLNTSLPNWLAIRRRLNTLGVVLTHEQIQPDRRLQLPRITAQILLPDSSAGSIGRAIL